MASTGRSCSERRQPGRARWSAYARPSRRGARLAPLALIVLAACSGERSAPTEPAADEAPRIEVALALRWDDLEDRLRMEVSVGNRDTLGRDVIIPTCSPTLDVYDPEDGRLVWSERRLQADTKLCQPLGPTITIMPGVMIGFAREVRDQDVLGDSLPAGTYRAVFRFTMQQPDDGMIVSVDGVRLGLP